MARQRGIHLQWKQGLMDHFDRWSPDDESEVGDLADQFLTSKVAKSRGAKVGDLGDLAPG
jgi:hypothetical protein